MFLQAIENFLEQLQVAIFPSQIQIHVLTFSDFYIHFQIMSLDVQMVQQMLSLCMKTFMLAQVIYTVINCLLQCLYNYI